MKFFVRTPTLCVLFDEDNDGVPEGEPISGSLRKSIYSTVHTYPAIDVYRVSVTEPNRPSVSVPIGTASWSAGLFETC